MEFASILAITIPISVGLIFAARILMNRGANGSQIAKEIRRDYEAILKSRDEYIGELQDAMRHYKNKASNMERGPRIEGNVEELDEILPELVKQFEPYAPKWLRPFLGNPDMQKWIFDYAQKNPEKVQKMIGKIVKPKGGTNEKIAPDAELSV